MTCKITYFFRDITSSTDNGWTESFFIGSGAAEQALAVATAPGWLNERLGFLMPTYQLAAIRAQNVANRFDNARQRFNAVTGRGQYNAQARAGNQGEAPWTGVLLRLVAGTITSRSMTVRGIPSNVVGDNLEYEPPATFQQRFDTWREDLTVAPNAYQLRHQMATPVVGVPLSIAVLGDQRSLALTFAANAAPPALTPRTVITMRGIQNASPTLGNWRVLSNDGTVITLYPRRRRVYGVPTPPTGISIVTYTYSPITDSDPIRGAERAAGRPSDRLRGLARARQG